MKRIQRIGAMLLCAVMLFGCLNGIILPAGAAAPTQKEAPALPAEPEADIPVESVESEAEIPAETEASTEPELTTQTQELEAGIPAETEETEETTDLQEKISEEKAVLSGLNYSIDNGEVTITDYTGSAKELTIPESIDGYPVTAIGKSAFASCKSLTSVAVPDSVTNIGEAAFYNCDSLTGITLPDGVTGIGDRAFYGCSSILSIAIPGSVSLIGENAFGMCMNLTEIRVSENNPNYSSDEFGALFNKSRTVLIRVPEKFAGEYIICDSVLRIGNYAFHGCADLSRVTIPDSVVTIGSYAFHSCNSLTSATIGNGVKQLGYYMFHGCTALTDITIPDSITTIASCAFQNCTGLTSITIPDSVTDISSNAFSNCSQLTSITIGSKVKRIGQKAFSGCSNLTMVNITDIVAWCKTSFDGWSSNPLSCGSNLYLNNTLVTELVIPDGVTAISSYVFQNCDSITSISFSNTVTYICSYAFYGCDNLTSISFPDNICTIDNYAFSNCDNLNSVTITDSTDIRYDAFSGCDIKELIIKDGTKMITSEMVICENSIEKVTIPDSVTSIGNWAFSGCTSLSSISIPNSVTTIGEAAFFGCDALTQVYISDISAWCTIDFKDGSANPLSNGSELYLNGDLITGLVIPCNEVTSIKNYAFYNCINLTSIIIPDGVTSIGNYAFGYCDDLTDITIGNGITNIGENAFSDCKNLTGVHISDLGAWCQINFASVTSSPLYYAGNLYLNGELLTEIQIPDGTSFIGNYAFYYSQTLTKVTIPDSVTSIGEYAFYYCKNLAAVTIPNSVTSIGKYAFYSCEDLTDLIIGSGIESIGREAFSSCYNLTNLYICDLAAWCGIHFESSNANPLSYAEHLYLNGSKLQHLQIPEGVASIGDYAFYNCEEILSVIIPDHVADIGKNAFCACKNLESVTIGKGVTVIGENAFRSCYKLQELVLGEYTSEIGNGAFYYCNALTDITLPDTLTHIGDDAFNNCSGLTSLVLPDSVIGIGRNAFWGCSITDISIGEKVTDIGESAFCACYALTEIRVDTDNPAYCNDEYGVLFDKDMTTLIQIPGGFAGSYTIPLSVTSIGIRAFYYCQKITEITIDSNVRSLEKEALSGCSNLEKIWVSPENITYSSDDRGVLYNKNKTELIHVPKMITGSYTVTSGVTTIGEYAFSNRDYLTSITLPDSITVIGSNAFQHCDRLTTIIFTGDTPEINSWAFSNISAVAYYPAGNDTWTPEVTKEDYSARDLAWYAYTPEQLEGEWLYQITDGEVTITGYNGSAEHIIIPAIIEDCPVTAIAPLALARRTNLVSIIIPESVAQIGRYAFYQCDNLVIVKFMGDCPAIDGEAFERITTVAYYPARRNTWSSEHFNHYGGSVTWRAYDENMPNTLASGKIDGFSWLLTDQGQLQFSGRGDMPDSQWSGYALSVKSVVFSNGITSIGKSAFSGCANLEEITIPESIKTIEGSAFHSCDSLANIVIPDSVTRIGSYAFAYCDNLTNVTIGRGVRTIEDGAFRSCANLKGVYISDLAGWCSISFGDPWGWDPDDEYANPLRYAKNLYLNNELVTELIIPSSVSTLHRFAFYNCNNLTYVVIPANVTMIEEFVFYGCGNLTGIQVSAQNKSYTSDSSGVLYNKNKTVLMCAPGQLQGSYQIPASVTDIGPFAFYQCKNLSSITIPDSVSEIDSGAFKGCSGLVNMTLPKNVTYISWWMFADCTSLTNVTVSDNVTSIGSYAFKGCTKLTGFVIPENVTYLSEQAFYGCTGLTSIRIPKGVTYISEYAFYGCDRLTSIDIPEGVKVIEEHAFASCDSLTGVIIPRSVTTIEKYAFYSCLNLRSIVISDGVAVLGAGAFGYNENLNTITFRGYPASISSYVFADVTATVYYPAENENWTAETMLDYGGSLTWVPYEAGYEIIIASGTCGDNLTWTLGDYGTLTISGTGSMYDRNIWYNHANSAYFSNIVRNVIIEEGVTTIGDYAFDYTHLTHITIPSSITSIGNSAFAGCESLSGITIPSSVTIIGSYAFSGCDSLTTVTIPDSVTSMGDAVFSSCENLSDVKLSKEITTIGDNMFFYCQKLSAIIVPDKVTSIGKNAFYYCISLNRIAIPGSVTSIASDAFYSCYNLEEISVDENNGAYCNDEHGVVLTKDQKQIVLAPATIQTYVVSDSVEKIDDYAFAYCKAMTSITIPVSVTAIGDSAFAYCTNLKTMYYYGSKQEWTLVSKGEDWDYKSFYLQLCMENPSKGLEMKLSSDENHYIVTGIGTCTDEEVRIPMAENNIPVTEIAPNAFANRRGIKKVVIPHTITQIGESAFAGCSDLEAVSYQGTENQWQQVELGSNWIDETVGDVTIEGAIPGDIDGNGQVNRDDVVALLLHVSMPQAFPISIPADYNGDGIVTRDDVIQLLLHISMPDAFPLQ